MSLAIQSIQPAYIKPLASPEVVATLEKVKPIVDRVDTLVNLQDGKPEITNPKVVIWVASVVCAAIGLIFGTLIGRQTIE